MRQHAQLLGHSDYGITELRTFEPWPLVAYTDNEEDTARLAMKLNGKVSGIYIGVQPRPLGLFDKAPNCWKPAHSSPESNCARDNDIEYITACFFDIDVVSQERKKGCPASEKELQQSLQAATLLSREDGLALSSSICCSGNGHYVLAPIVPIPVHDVETAAKFKYFCQQVTARIAAQVEGVKIDAVYNLSRVMRVMGTVNRKGQPTPDRPHRTGHFVTDPAPAQSFALHHMILNTEVPTCLAKTNPHQTNIKCDLAKIEACEFIMYCRHQSTIVPEPLWFAMITNLAYLEGGQELVHEISRLDKYRYDYQQTQRRIERALQSGYSAASCETIKSLGFQCPKLGHCHARAPMYLTHLFSIWTR